MRCDSIPYSTGNTYNVVGIYDRPYYISLTTNRKCIIAMEQTTKLKTGGAVIETNGSSVTKRNVKTIVNCKN